LPEDTNVVAWMTETVVAGSKIANMRRERKHVVAYGRLPSFARIKCVSLFATFFI